MNDYVKIALVGLEVLIMLPAIPFFYYVGRATVAFEIQKYGKVPIAVYVSLGILAALDYSNQFYSHDVSSIVNLLMLVFFFAQIRTIYKKEHIVEAATYLDFESWEAWYENKPA